MVFNNKMEDQRASNSVMAAIISFGATMLSWFSSHGAAMASLVAIVAGIYSAHAAHTSSRANKKRIQVMDEQLKLMAKAQGMSIKAVEEAMRD